jgi:hypothetical protein
MRTRKISIKYDLSSLTTTSNIRECSIIILFALLLPSQQLKSLSSCNGLSYLQSKALPINLRNNSYSSRTTFLLSTTVDTATATRQRKSKLEKDGGIVYRQSVCSQYEMELIQKETSIITKHHLTNERSSIAQNRLGAALSSSTTTANNNSNESSDTLRILNEGGSIYSLVQRLIEVPTSSEESLAFVGADGGTGQTTTAKTKTRKIQLCQEIPVEVRSYEKIGASMSWHKDECLYDPPQFEFIFTVENNSDCVTMWKKNENENEKENNINDKNKDENENVNEIHSQETHPNSLLLLQAGPDGPEHCVTSLKHGRRVILKCAYIYEGSTYIGGEERNLNQFGNNNKKATTKSKSKSDNKKGRKRNTRR